MSGRGRENHVIRERIPSTRELKCPRRECGAIDVEQAAADAGSQADTPAERRWVCLACGKPFRLTVATSAPGDVSRSRR